MVNEAATRRHNRKGGRCRNTSGQDRAGPPRHVMRVIPVASMPCRRADSLSCSRLVGRRLALTALWNDDSNHRYALPSAASANAGSEAAESEGETDTAATDSSLLIASAKTACNRGRSDRDRAPDRPSQNYLVSVESKVHFQARS